MRKALTLLASAVLSDGAVTTVAVQAPEPAAPTPSRPSSPAPERGESPAGQ